MNKRMNREKLQIGTYCLAPYARTDVRYGYSRGAAFFRSIWERMASILLKCIQTTVFS